MVGIASRTLDTHEPFGYNTAMPTTHPRVKHTLGTVGQYHHTFEDFDIPKVYALITPINEYDMKSARVYTPNPWYPDKIHFYDWVWSKDDGIWRRTQGGTFKNVEEAREDWKTRKAKGHIPQDMIAKPINGEIRPAWDHFAEHFCPHGTYGFHELIRSYNNTYPIKKVA